MSKYVFVAAVMVGLIGCGSAKCTPSEVIQCTKDFVPLAEKCDGGNCTTPEQKQDCANAVITAIEDCGGCIKSTLCFACKKDICDKDSSNTISGYCNKQSCNPNECSNSSATLAESLAVV